MKNWRSSFSFLAGPSLRSEHSEKGLYIAITYNRYRYLLFIGYSSVIHWFSPIIISTTDNHLLIILFSPLFSRDSFYLILTCLFTFIYLLTYRLLIVLTGLVDDLTININNNKILQLFESFLYLHSTYHE